MSLGSVLTKAIGAYTLYSSLWDSHIIGISNKNKYPQAKIAKDYTDMYINSQRMNIKGTYLPVTVSIAQKKFLNFFLDDLILPSFYGVIGYLSGLKQGLFHNGLPIGLSIGALTMNSKSPLQKLGGRACAALILLGALKSFIFDVAGVGQYKKI